jgi:hypothetical protein
MSGDIHRAVPSCSISCSGRWSTCSRTSTGPKCRTNPGCLVSRSGASVRFCARSVSTCAALTIGGEESIKRYATRGDGTQLGAQAIAESMARMAQRAREAGVASPEARAIDAESNRHSKVQGSMPTPVRLEHSAFRIEHCVVTAAAVAPASGRCLTATASCRRTAASSARRAPQADRTSPCRWCESLLRR